MKSSKIVCIIVTALCFFAVGAMATVPSEINFQGTLTDTSGNPITGNRTMQFSLYADSVGGSALWSELNWSMNIVDGLFHVQLGSITALSSSNFDGDVLWLGIQVSPDPSELSPRQPLVTVPYGFRSTEADHATTADSAQHTLIADSALHADYSDTANYALSSLLDDDWTVNADTIYHLNGNVGIGTATPSYKLHVEGQAISGESSTASGTYSTISGGYMNISSDLGTTVAGGRNNLANDEGCSILGGRDNLAGNEYATVGGGYDNLANGYNSTISGGGDNAAGGDVSTIGGGEGNSADSLYGVVDGGYRNSSIGSYSTIGGGGRNFARGRFSVVGGGGGTAGIDSNSAVGDHSVVGGGKQNSANEEYTIVGGGFGNTVSGERSIVAGGWHNDIPGESCFIGGGGDNFAGEIFTTVSGGWDNSASTLYATVGGGSGNSASGGYATVGGGSGNTASATCAVVAGGCASRADGENSAIGGGSNNVAAGLASTIPGGLDNLAEGDYTVAMGRQAKAVHDGSFVWADGSGSDYATSADNQFLIRANGGVGIGTTHPQEQLDVAGKVACSGLQEASDIRFKNNIRTLNDALDKVSSLRGVAFEWNQNSASIGAIPGSEQIGVVAQEVELILPQLVSTSDDGYKSVDYTKFTAVLIEAVKELKEQNQTLMQRIEKLESNAK